MGYPNPGLKHPQHAQNRIRHPDRILPNSDDRSLFRYGKSKSLSAHGPAPRYGPSKASLTEDEISSSLEGHPSGPLDARTDSASLEDPSAEPSTRPRGRSNLCLVRDHLWRTEATAQLPHWTGRIYSPTTPRRGHGWRTVSGGVSWHWPSCHTADVTGVSSACTRHCAAIPGAGRDCGALCGLD